MGLGFKEPFTAEFARELFSYDPLTGIVTRRVEAYGRGGKFPIGSEVGSSDGKGYLETEVRGHRVRLHRLIWLLVHGKWPTVEIDHRDLDGMNNRLANLREATHSQNGMNKGLKSNNTSGVTGVHFDRSRGKWAAAIKRDKKHVNLGRFETKEAAIAARLAAQAEHYGEFARAA